MRAGLQHLGSDQEAHQVETCRGDRQEGEVRHQGLHRGGALPHVRRVREERAAGLATRHEPRQEPPQHECPGIQGREIVVDQDFPQILKYWVTHRANTWVG